MDEGFVRILEAIRVEYGKPMVVTSAYRCPDWNKAISTGLNGPHTTGKAIDIQCYGPDAHELLTIALKAGVKGVGVSQKGAHNKRFIHMDTLDEPNRPFIWGY
jgi:uncharacterized protein YcbK (DUF882 family)